MILRKNHVTALAQADKRIDGRKLDEFRKMEIEPGVIANADGSARVRLGKTEIIAGVKMGMGTPFPDKKDEGVLMTGAELSPLASPDFETGPPTEQAIELARVVDRGIRESKMIDTKKLCVEEGEKVWMVSVDLQIINDDGNLIDCGSVAAVVALMNAKFPKFDGENVEYGTKTDNPLPITCKPVAVTATKIGSKMILDCSREEEDAAETWITVTTKDDGNICALQKSGTEPLTMEEIEKAFDLSTSKGKEIRAVLDKVKA